MYFAPVVCDGGHHCWSISIPSIADLFRDTGLWWKFHLTYALYSDAKMSGICRNMHHSTIAKENIQCQSAL